MLFSRLEDNPAVQRLTHGKDTLPLSSLIQEALTIAMSYRAEKRSIIVVKNSLYNAQRLYDRMSTLLGEKECALFGVDESLRVEALDENLSDVVIEDKILSFTVAPNTMIDKRKMTIEVYYLDGWEERISSTLTITQN